MPAFRTPQYDLCPKTSQKTNLRNHSWLHLQLYLFMGLTMINDLRHDLLCPSYPPSTINTTIICMYAHSVASLNIISTVFSPSLFLLFTQDQDPCNWNMILSSSLILLTYSAVGDFVSPLLTPECRNVTFKWIVLSRLVLHPCNFKTILPLTYG